MTSAARRYAPNGAIAQAYAARYQLYGEINQAMSPMWERIAQMQAQS